MQLQVCANTHYAVEKYGLNLSGKVCNCTLIGFSSSFVFPSICGKGKAPKFKAEYVFMALIWWV